MAEELLMEVDDLLPIVEAATLLGVREIGARRRGNHAQREGVRRSRYSDADKVCSAKPRWRMSPCFSR